MEVLLHMSKKKPMTELAVRQAKPGPKDYSLYDAGGLYVIVKTTGAKWWRWRYTFLGKKKTLSLGVHPHVSLAAARETARKYNHMCLEGRDPGAARKGEAKAQADTFEAVAREWFARNLPTWKPSHSHSVIRRLERDVFPWLGGRPVAEIDAKEVLPVLRRVSDAGKRETAKREKQIVGQVFRYAAALGMCSGDPTSCLDKMLPPPRTKHYPAITDERELGELLRAMWDYPGGLIVRVALKLSAYAMLRPGEVRKTEWAWVNLEKKLIEYPVGSMKDNDRPHLVPITRQIAQLLEEIRPLSGQGRYLFPCGWGGKDGRPMSEAGVLQALRRLGYTKDQLCAHSFRTTASTILNESHQWSADAIELQLHHAPKNQIRAIYNRAQLLDERRAMLQWYCDKLDQLRTSAEAKPVMGVFS